MCVRLEILSRSVSVPFSIQSVVAINNRPRKGSYHGYIAKRKHFSRVAGYLRHWILFTAELHRGAVESGKEETNILLGVLAN